MTSFAVLPRDGAAPFTAERLDINLWILPGVLGRQVIYCDLGLRIHLPEGTSPSARLEFDLALPFEARADGIIDLIPVMRDDKEVCMLIFGDADAVPILSNGWREVDDGSGLMRLLPLRKDECKQELSVHRPSFSTWKLSAGPSTVAAGSTVYMRFRFQVKDSGSAWAWQRGERRRSHAISDLRVNELRDRPIVEDGGPDFESALGFGRVNAFVICQARFKAGRVSPLPKYVRILEGAAWEKYVLRRLSRSNEPFVITYWPQPDVHRKKPFRGFLEVERRRPTSAKWSLASAALVILALVLLQSSFALSQSIFAKLALGIWTLAASVVTVATVAVAWKLVSPFVVGGRWRRLSDLIEKYERRRYRR